MASALVTPAVLQWARERRGLDKEELRAKVGKRLPPGTVEEWEHGASSPSWPQARKLARQLQVPLGYLVLPAPPDLSIPIPDLRTVGDGETSLGADFHEVVNDALRKQEWYREYLLANP